MLFLIEKYLIPTNVSDDQTPSLVGQYSPAPVIVQTNYNYRYIILLFTLFRKIMKINSDIFFYSSGYMGPDAGVGASKRMHDDLDSSPGSPAPLAIVESPEPIEQQQQSTQSQDQVKRQRIEETDEH